MSSNGWPRPFAESPACGFSTRLESAACGLRMSAQSLEAEDRAKDPCLQQFERLCQQDDAALIAELEAAKWLEPEDLYYLGFHLAGRPGPPRKFAGDVLKLVLKRSPRSKLAQSARSKLRSEGLE